jgi:hypothetical protein
LGAEAKGVQLLVRNLDGVDLLGMKGAAVKDEDEGVVPGTVWRNPINPQEVEPVRRRRGVA